MKRLISLILFVLIAQVFCQSSVYSVYDFEPVTVTGSRIPTEFSNTSRNVQIVSAEEINSIPASSLTGLLQSVSDLDFQTRGVLGVQSDVSIRGASNEQTLVMLDGVKISDSQTAHHSMNIPVNLSDIKKIEILKGNASKIYGPNALGGVINIITKNAEEKNGSLRLSGGDFGYQSGQFSYSIPYNHFSTRFSISEKRSDGYIENTDFKIRNFFYKTGLQKSQSKYTLSLGYQKKEFGANRFYTSSPSERENTEQLLANVSGFHITNWGHLSVKLSGRKNFDHFLIPDYSYVNKHTTYQYSGEVSGLYAGNKLTLNFGADLGYSSIDGYAMNHDRMRAGLFSEAAFNIGIFELAPGISGYYYKEWDLQLFPGIDIGVNLSDNWRVFSSVGRSFRVPSFTDLFYSGVENMGNADLKPETALSYELGTQYQADIVQSGLTIFHRNTTDLIDWARLDTSKTYYAQNIPSIKTYGAEVSLKFRTVTIPLLKNMDIHYSYYNYAEDYQTFQVDKTRYSWNRLTQNFIINFNFLLPYNVNMILNVEQVDRIDENYGDHTLANLQMSKRLDSFEFTLNIKNLMNTDYQNWQNRPMPPRWFSMGIKYQF